jgi:hypothetical protein
MCQGRVHKSGTQPVQNVLTEDMEQFICLAQIRQALHEGEHSRNMVLRSLM